jgi:hypothetical protein
MSRGFLFGDVELLNVRLGLQRTSRNVEGGHPIYSATKIARQAA